MTIDLKPRHSAADWFRSGSFWWAWLLDAGAGWPLGCYAGVMPGTYVYTPDPTRRGDPYTNDGYRVTAAEAREMARLTRYVVAQQRALQRTLEALLPEARARVDRAERHDPFDSVYRRPVRDDFIARAEAFADWAERSGGFRIY